VRLCILVVSHVKLVLFFLVSVFGLEKVSEECNRSCWECMLSPPSLLKLACNSSRKFSDRLADFVISPCVHLYPTFLN
jgi:hypothetical protein